MHIGHHGRQSQTFMPQIVQDPNNPDNAYCDCPGFLDSRGAEINIANVINIRKILQQASGVKAVFLTSYHELLVDRGRCIRAMETTCREMFGGADNLRRHQNTVLLGITKAPRYNASGRPLSVRGIRLKLRDSGSSIAQILAERIFLFDPLDRGSNNPDFWSLARCRTEIAQLQSIPQSVATTLFRVPLADSDHRHLLTTVRGLRSEIVSTIERLHRNLVSLPELLIQPAMIATNSQTVEPDGTLFDRILSAVFNHRKTRSALRPHWQLLLRLKVIEHPEVDQLIEGEVLPAINTVILQRASAIRDDAQAYQFYIARRELSQLRNTVNNLPGAPIICDIDALGRYIARCEAAYEDQRRRQVEMERLNAELADTQRRIRRASGRRDECTIS
jgi:hypothetical protein